MKRSVKVFSNTDYLGALEEEAFEEYIREGIDKYGLHFAGSRHSNTCPEVYDLMEDCLKKMFISNNVITGSSGSFMGSLIGSFCETREQVFFNSDLHPALQLSQKNAQRFEDQGQLIYLMERSTCKDIVVLVNSIHPMTLNSLDKDLIQQFPENKQIHLIVDDSHGIGVTGKDGAGIYELAKSNPGHVQLSVLASLGKAYSVPCGAVMGSEELIGFIRNSARWGGSSPMPPAYAWAFLNMRTFYASSLQKLRENLNTFFGHVDTSLVDHLDGFPVFILKPPKMLRFLQQFGYTISSFSYPNAESHVVERIVINSAKKKIDILGLAEAVNLKTSIV